MPIHRFVAVVLATSAFHLTAYAQEPVVLPPAPQQTEIMIVGTFHFAQVDTNRTDVLDEQHQRSISQIVENLARFQPTKVMVERQPYFWQERFDFQYAAYQNNEFDLPRNEIYQLGFKLAARVDLEDVLAIDHAGFWRMDTVRVVAEEYEQLDLLEGNPPNTVPRTTDVLSRNKALSTMSIRQYLRRLNDPGYQVWHHNGYIDRIMRVGISPNDRFDLSDNEAGGNLIGDWYRRNLLIYRHILGRTEFGNDRIVVIIGADHVHTLKQFFGDNFNFTVVEANDYL